MNDKEQSIFYKKIFIVITIIIFSSLHYFTTTNIHFLHDIYQRLYYIPIICASVWFGIKGGLSASAVISLIYIGHVVFQWKIMPHMELQKYLEIVLFNLVALITGLLTEREQKLKNKYLDTADMLKESYDKLKIQAKDMIEIEEQLRRADRLTMLGQISAELAHEIRNPLGSILGTAEIIKKDYNKDDKQHEFIEIMLKETKRLNDVLKNFLNFTREGEASDEMTDVNLLIHDAVNFLKLQFDKKNVSVALDLDENIEKIKLDGEQLKQVFFNIIINGVQSMPTGGKLTITTGIKNDDGKDFLCIDFVDTGIGISEKNIENLFKPFYTSKNEGTGLGLSISQKIIEKFDGEITVQSRINAGSTFTVKLPYLSGKENAEKKDINNR
jgi:signal transduction histidine kinase